MGPDDPIFSVEKRGPPANPTTTIGSTDSAFIDPSVAVWAPDRRLNLIGQARWIIFEIMLRDTAIIAAGVRLFLNLMADAVWTVNPPEDLNDNELAVAQGYADQAYDAIFGMTTSWSTIVRKLAMFRMLGFAIMEWTAKKNPDGSIGLLDIEHRPQRTITRWLRDPGGTITGVVQQVSGRSQVTLPRSKIVYAVDDLLTDNPEGVGLFRHLATTNERLRLFLELEEVGFTTDLRGIPIVRAPLAEEQKAVEEAGAPNSPERLKALAALQAKMQPLRDFVNKHIRNKKLGMTLPSDTYNGKTVDGGITPSTVPKWAIELLNGNSQSFEAMAAAVKRLNNELAMILGVEHLLIGQDGSGSLALMRSKIGTFYLTVTSTLQDMIEVIDRDVIEPLSELNGWDEHLRPQMGVNEINERDVTDMADALLKLAQAGAVLDPSDPAIGEMRDLMGLSRPPDPASDLSLVPGRKGPVAAPRDPNKPLENNPEDQNQPVQKARVIRSRRRLRKRSR